MLEPFATVTVGAIVVLAASVIVQSADLYGHWYTNRRISREMMPRLDAAEARGARILELLEAKPRTLQGGHDPREMATLAVAAREEKAVQREENDSLLLDKLAEVFGGMENAIAVRESCEAWLPGKWKTAVENIDRYERILGPVLKHVKFRKPEDGGAAAAAKFETW